MSSIVPVDWNPDTRKLRFFSWAWLAFLGVAWPLLLLFRGHPRTSAVICGVGIAGGLLGLIRPAWLRPAWIVLIAASWPIGWVISNVALIVLYFGVVTPLALVARLRGRDPLRVAT